MTLITTRDYDLKESVCMEGAHCWFEVPTYCNRNIIEAQEFGFEEGDECDFTQMSIWVDDVLNPKDDFQNKECLF